jgi:hypothetical protein
MATPEQTKLSWPINSEYFERELHATEVDMYLYLLNELLRVANKTHGINFALFIQEFTRIFYGILDGFEVKSRENHEARQKMNSFLEKLQTATEFKQFFSDTENLAPLIAYSLLTGKVVTELPLAFQEHYQMAKVEDET